MSSISLQEKIVEIMHIYGRMPRLLTLLEVWRAVGTEYTLSEVNKTLSGFIGAGEVGEYKGFYGSDRSRVNVLVEQRIRQDIVADEKWKRFLQLRKLFAYIPFVDFVYAAGSMAMGNVGRHSDFDVVIGARRGRIFSTRFFCILLFGAARQRRKKFSHHEDASNKICLNHFVTEQAYCLSPPYNIYWQQLYKNFVLLYGDAAVAEVFVRANEWAGMRAHYDRRCYQGERWVKRFLESLLSGWLGDVVEKTLKTLQERRIMNTLHRRGELGHAPRITHNDIELEFHPDTRRIEEMVKVR